MGDAADYEQESKPDNYLDHLAGCCDEFFCMYCEDEGFIESCDSLGEMPIPVKTDNEQKRTKKTR